MLRTFATCGSRECECNRTTHTRACDIRKPERLPDLTNMLDEQASRLLPRVGEIIYLFSNRRNGRHLCLQSSTRSVRIRYR